MNKTTKVYLKTYFYGIPCLGHEIKLSGKWATTITNGEYVLSFEDMEGNWISDCDLIVVTIEEYINECSNSGR